MANRFCTILLTFLSFSALVKAQYMSTPDVGDCRIRYWRFYKYTTSQVTKQSISSEESCVSLCWRQNERGNPCKSVNYIKDEKVCKLMPIALSVELERNGRIQWCNDSNYIEPVECNINYFNAQLTTTLRPSSDTLVQGAVRPTNNIRPGSCGQTSVPQRARTNRFDQRIVGGNEAKQNSIPFIVSLRTWGFHSCGGTLVRVSPNKESDIIVTAAHCLRPGNANFDVVAGAHYRNRTVNGEQKVGAEKVVIHPNYNNPIKLLVYSTIKHFLVNKNFLASTANDIAIVKLRQPIKFSQTVQPACLPTSKSEGLADKTNGVVAGWGTTEEGGNLADALMQVVVPVVGTTQCKKAYSTLVPDAMMCAGYDQGQKDSCQGDLGGPYYFEGKQGYTLQGIVSFGAGCARPRYPGIYSTNYIDWIQTQIKSLSSIRA